MQKALVKIFSLCYNINLFGGVAHLGERDIRIVEVTGSSPAVSTIQKALKPCGFGAFFFCGNAALKKRCSTACSTISNTFSNTFTEICAIHLCKQQRRADFCKRTPAPFGAGDLDYSHERNRIPPFDVSTVRTRLTGVLSATFRSK